MALSIKTRRADELARELTRITGRSITHEVEMALEERLERQQAARKSSAESADELMTWVRETFKDYDRRPVSKAEWDWASGDED